jgi:hypothetical protein
MGLSKDEPIFFKRLDRSEKMSSEPRSDQTTVHDGDSRATVLRTEAGMRAALDKIAAAWAPAARSLQLRATRPHHIADSPRPRTAISTLSRISPE